MSDAMERLIHAAGSEAAGTMVKYMDAILDKNQYINLTAVTDRDEFIVKHILDSLSCVNSQEWKNASRIVDIGTGAGFPGVPLAVFSPDKNFLLIDSSQKKLKVIDEITDLLGIRNVKTLHIRAEDAGQIEEYREKFDICVSRAVSSLNVLAEWCLPLVKKNGTFVSYKGGKAGQELEDAKKAIQILGGKVDRVEKADLSSEDADNHMLIYINKVKNTPKKYPRKPGIARKNPL